jgi:hypothetical protein
MHSARDVLDLWERAAACPPLERGLVMLESAGLDAPSAGLDGLGALTVGECEERLLALHERLFGGRLNGFAECPRCGAALQLGINIQELRASLGGAAPAGAAALTPTDVQVPADAQSLAPTGAQVLTYGEYDVRFRLLTGADLVDAAACPDVSAARALLVERAVVTASRRGRRVRVSRLPVAVVEQLAQRLGACDPWAAPLLELVCSECSNQWTVLLDVSVFLWTEFSSRARRVLHEVHTLALAYGWREADIVAMSGRRREAYLALVGA